MGTIVLIAHVTLQEDRYLACVDALQIEGEGATAALAQDGLINALRAWIEVQDGAGMLETSLAQAGFEGVSEDTEVQLEFTE